VPSIYQFTRTNEGREMLKLGLVKPNSYARPYAMPLGVPSNHVRAVEAAFENAERIREFVAEAKRTRMALNPIPWTKLHNMIVEGLSMPAGAQRKAQADPRAEGLA
jgi:hypothetical protein